MKKFSIAIHGGAGTILPSRMDKKKEIAYRAALESAVNSAYNILHIGGSALDAVEKAVSDLEDTPLFNAGKGSVFTSVGTNEMDASIMDGNTLDAGAAAMVKGVKNPIKLARVIMEKSDHVFLAGSGAEEFAKLHKLKFEEDEYFYDELRYQQLMEIVGTEKTKLDHDSVLDGKFGTVGAVALDVSGNLAAATSTGGMTNKRFGRIGDSPMIGAGNYANNKSCAVSCTGNGEFFIRGVAAYDVSCLMEYKGLSLKKACQEVVHHRLIKIGGEGGLIAVDGQGNIALEFNTAGMYRASRLAGREAEVHIYK